MKKIFSIALAATLLAAGCQKTEVIGLDESKTGPAMTFSTEMKKITKAEGDATTNPGELPNGDANLQANGFRVWAYADYDLTVNSNNVNTSNRIYDGMAGDLMKYNSGAWEHFANKEYYWPAEERNLMFFAVSAQEESFVVNDAGIISNVIPSHGIPDAYPANRVQTDFTGVSLQVKDFIVSNIATEKTANTPAIPVASNDLMIADFRNQNSDQNGKAVNLNFNHALTKVQFVFSTTTDPYYKKDAPEVINGEKTTEDINPAAPKVFVQKVEVDGLFNKGTLNVTPTTGDPKRKQNDNAAISSISLTWDPSTLTTSYNDDNTAFTATWPDPERNFPEEFEEEGANGNMTEVTEDEQRKSLLLTDSPKTFATWFMLPQSLAGKKVTITYVINKRQFSAMFPLEGSTGNTISAWGVNQYVKYNISLTPDMILFGATVENWVPDNNGGDGESLQD